VSSLNRLGVGRISDATGGNSTGTGILGADGTALTGSSDLLNIGGA
jgi:hypothetical protein